MEKQPLPTDDDKTGTTESTLDGFAGEESQQGSSEPAARAGWNSKIEYFLAQVGFSVGLGNVWRFPYLCHQNGGGAFLLLYVLLMLVVGIPLFFLELAAGQAIRQGSIGVWRYISPRLAGIGYSSCVVCFFVALYYNVILAWSLFYLGNSFQYPLPWEQCPEQGNVTVNECEKSSPTSYFWYRKALDITDSIDEMGSFNTYIVCCLLAAWTIVCLGMFKGIKSSVKGPGELSCLGCSLTSVSQRGREDRTNTRQRETRHPRFDLRRISGHMAGLAALCLLLVFPLSSSQSTLRSEQQINVHQAPAAPPSPPHIRDLLKKEETAHLNAKRTYAHVDKDNAKVGLFIAAAMGTFALMAAVYCIYNKFYTKHQYLHTQLNDDSDLTTDPMEPPPVFFHASAGPSALDVRRAGYGSLSDTPSIISVPPSLSPPPAAMPFPPLFLSSHSLRTISARDLEKSCI